MSVITEEIAATKPEIPSTIIETLPPLVPDLDADPFAGIPRELIDLVGTYDRDTAGGCG